MENTSSVLIVPESLEDVSAPRTEALRVDRVKTTSYPAIACCFEQKSKLVHLYIWAFELLEVGRRIWSIFPPCRYIRQTETDYVRYIRHATAAYTLDWYISLQRAVFRMQLRISVDKGRVEKTSGWKKMRFWKKNWKARLMVYGGGLIHQRVYFTVASQQLFLFQSHMSQS